MPQIPYTDYDKNNSYLSTSYNSMEGGKEPKYKKYMRTHTLLNYWVKAVSLATIIVIGCAQLAYAGEERYSDYRDIDKVGILNDTFIVTDNRYGDPGLWAEIDETVFVDNLLLFEVNEHGRKIIASPSTFTANIEISLWRDRDTIDRAPGEIILESLEFTYDPNTATVTPYRKFKRYNGAHKMRIVIQSVMSSAGGIESIPDLRITGEIHLSRFYDFNFDNSPAFIPVDDNATISDTYTAQWAEKLGAEVYDLEWVHYDKESVVGADFANDNIPTGVDFNALFKNNSTRVTVGANSYKLNLLYRKGFLLFRIRGVRPKGAFREHSVWSSTPYYITLPERENDINWQSSVVYAEEGKHIPSTQYFDGTMRNRQSVTLSNAIGRTIVGQTMYDYHGRPAVSVLPVPTEETTLSYQQNFALLNPTNPFTKEAWEDPNCIEDAPVLSASPASNYYSGDNPRADQGANQYIPDADGYTYTMTEYTPDLTGRIQTQSGVGEAFAMGKGHETRYYYAKPTQRELDRLFGSDVGDANHYLKNGVVDPNGQLSLSYIDGHGRVIATSLAGEKPDNVEQIDEGYVLPEQNIVDILYNQEQGNSLVSTYKFIVAAPGEHTFNYGLTSDQYENDCTPLCFDCKYDLIIELSRTDCRPIGAEQKIVRTLKNYNLSELNNDCISSTIDEGIIQDLEIGEYSITKTLTVNQESLDYYTEIFLAQDSCVPSIETLRDKYLEDLDFSTCNITCAECEEALGTEMEYIAAIKAQFDQLGDELDDQLDEPLADLYDEDVAKLSYKQAIDACRQPCIVPTECDVIFGMMLADVSKGGQYAPVQLANGAYENNTTSLEVFGKFDQLEDGVIYTNEDGTPSKVINSANQEVTPDELDFQEFMRKWQPSWAEALVHNHPEYCIYENWCLAPELEDTHEWERDILAADTWADAVDAMLVDSDGIINDPYFATDMLGEYCIGERDSMINNIVVEDPSSPSILDIAIQTIYGKDSGCTNGLGEGTDAEKNAVWEIYRELYLSIRLQLMTKGRNALTVDCTDPSLLCIGNDCGISPNPYRNKQARFQSLDFTGERMSEVEANGIKASNVAEILASCQTSCEDNADVWMLQLEGCLTDIPSAQLESVTANIKARLIAVCKLGCDLEHPFGASSSAGGVATSFGDTSFEDIINTIQGDPAGQCDIDCTPYSISGMYPHEAMPYPGIQPLIAKGPESSDCLCEQITALETCYATDNQGYDAFTDFLGQFSALTLPQSDIDVLKNYCATRNPSEACNFIPRDVLIPPILECGVCKDCDDITPLVAIFDQQCNPTDTDQYYEQLTKYLNNKLGWVLAIDDYRDFVEKCNGGGSTCSVTTVLCPSSPLLKDDNPLDNCEEHLRRQAETNAISEYNRLYDKARREFQEGYLTKCLTSATETFTGDMLTHEYHYTLYYYDQAGNLVQTVPPNGVRPIAGADSLANIAANRLTEVDAPIFPPHSFFTKYVYNTLNQVVQQISPDTDIKLFFYDDVGRLIVSQDGRQKDLYDDDLLDGIPADLKAYSYTIYDDLGRIIEVGEKSTTTPFTEDLDFDTWINQGDLSSRTHVTKTYYDEQPVFGQAAIDIANAANLRTRVAAVTIESTYDGDDSTYDYGTHYSYDASGNVQTLVQELVELNDIGHRYKRMDYDYDYISGNVNAVYYQRGKADQFTHRYTYDENNRLSEVFTSLIHDHANPAGLNVLLWDRDAAYEYYDHGPLSRVEIGEYRVQGMDYAYTLQGWIKGVNSSGLREDKDMGGDGLLINGIMNPPNGGVARDALAYSLNYYQDNILRDFDAIGVDPFMEVESSTVQGASPSLYNGNIRHMTIDNKKLDGGPMAYTYKYDQLHRIKGMESHNNADIDAYAWGATDSNPSQYSMATSYDGNGNILEMLRNGIKEGQEASSEISNIDYEYKPGTNMLMGTMKTIKCDPEVLVPSATTGDIDIKAGERLIASSTVDGSATVNFRAGEEICLNPGFEVEAISTGIFIAEIKTCEEEIIDSDYVYDGTGNLIKNESGAAIRWSPYGKVLAVTKEDDTQVVSFGYDAAQNRSKKSVVNTATNINRDVYYIRDASGNTMGVYEKTLNSEASAEELGEVMVWKEQYLYGSSRLGGIKPLVEWTTTLPNTPTYQDSISIGWKYYEAGNHLGNVLSVANDRKEKIDIDGDNEADYFEATILSATDYYPFGMDMPSRTYASADYRYGFNGKEKDPGAEWGDGNHYDYGFRIYNPEIAKFLSVDPLTVTYPMLTPYQFASNTPIQAIDLDGLEAAAAQIFVAQTTALATIDAGGEEPGIGNYVRAAGTLMKGGLIGLKNSVVDGVVGPFVRFTGAGENMLRNEANHSLNYGQNIENKVRNGEVPSEVFVEHNTNQLVEKFNLANGSLEIMALAAGGAEGGPLGGMAKLKNIKVIGKVDDVSEIFRVQGGTTPNASRVRFRVSEGDLVIDGEDMLFITINDESRALEFLAKRGEDAYLFRAQVNQSFADKIRKNSVKQADGKANPGAPQRVDETRTSGSYGIPKEYFDELLENIKSHNGGG